MSWHFYVIKVLNALLLLGFADRIRFIPALIR